VKNRHLLDLGVVFAVGLLAGAGALAFVTSMVRPVDDASDESMAPLLETTAEPPRPTVSVVESSAPLEVTGLDPSIVTVLGTSGFAERVSRSQLETELDPSIVSVLVTEASGLSVARDEGLDGAS
jgi:hypothetical protein